MAGTLYEQEDRGNLIPYLKSGDLWLLKDIRANYLQTPPLADMATNDASVRSRILQLNNWYGEVDRYFESIEYGTRRDVYQKYISYSDQAFDVKVLTQFSFVGDGSVSFASIPERRTGARQWLLQMLNDQDRNLRFEMLKAIELNQNDDGFISHEFLVSTAKVAAVVATIYVGGVAAGAWGGAAEGGAAAAGAGASAGASGAAGAGASGAAAGGAAAGGGAATGSGALLGQAGLLTGAETATVSSFTLGGAAEVGAGGSLLSSLLSTAQEQAGSIAIGVAKETLNNQLNPKKAPTQTSLPVAGSQQTQDQISNSSSGLTLAKILTPVAAVLLSLVV